MYTVNLSIISRLVSQLWLENSSPDFILIFKVQLVNQLIPMLQTAFQTVCSCDICLLFLSKVASASATQASGICLSSNGIHETGITTCSREVGSSHLQCQNEDQQCSGTSTRDLIVLAVFFSRISKHCSMLSAISMKFWYFPINHGQLDKPW